MRIDKTISLSTNPKVPLSMNVYLRVQNLLDKRNVDGVYSATGSPNDDGYLTSARGQSELANTEASRPNDIEAYRHSYMDAYVESEFLLVSTPYFLGGNI